MEAAGGLLSSFEKSKTKVKLLVPKNQIFKKKCQQHKTACSFLIFQPSGHFWNGNSSILVPKILWLGAGFRRSRKTAARAIHCLWSTWLIFLCSIAWFINWPWGIPSWARPRPFDPQISFSLLWLTEERQQIPSQPRFLNKAAKSLTFFSCFSPTEAIRMSVRLRALLNLSELLSQDHNCSCYWGMTPSTWGETLPKNKSVLLPTDRLIKSLSWLLLSLFGRMIDLAVNWHRTLLVELWSRSWYLGLLGTRQKLALWDIALKMTGEQMWYFTSRPTQVPSKIMSAYFPMKTIQDKGSDSWAPAAVPCFLCFLGKNSPDLQIFCNHGFPPFFDAFCGCFQEAGSMLLSSLDFNPALSRRNLSKDFSACPQILMWHNIKSFCHILPLQSHQICTLLSQATAQLLSFLLFKNIQGIFLQACKQHLSTPAPEAFMATGCFSDLWPSNTYSHWMWLFKPILCDDGF